MINLIFDCDGTLLDSYGAITDRVCRVFEKHGIICDPEKVRELALYQHVGYCISEIAMQNHLDADLLLNDYKSVGEKLELITPMKHVREVLENEKFRCFMYTHRGESCRRIMAKLELDTYFTEIVDGTYHLRKKPDSQGIDYLVEKYGLDRKQTYYVGDRLLDIECGMNAHIKTIFLKSSGLDIDCSQADFVIDDLLEINMLPL